LSNLNLTQGDRVVIQNAVSGMNRDPWHPDKTRSRVGIPSALMFCVCALFLPGRCSADEVNVNFVDSSLTALPGQTVVFMGTINNAIEDTADFTFSFSGYDASVLTPVSLLPSPDPIGAGATSTTDLFSVTLSSAIAPGTYPVDFELLGVGVHTGEMRSQDGEVTITVTPEPSTLWLMATGLIIFATTLPVFRSRKSKKAA
jgi:hypothetical protein